MPRTSPHDNDHVACHLNSHHQSTRRHAAILNNQGVRQFDKCLHKEAVISIKTALSIFTCADEKSTNQHPRCQSNDLLSARISDVATLDCDIPVSPLLYVYQRELFDEGMATCDRAFIFNESEACTDEQHFKAIMYHNLGLALLHEQKYKESIDAFVASLAAEECSNRYFHLESIVVSILHNTARALYFVGKNKEAADVYREALQYEEVLKRSPEFDEDRIARLIVSTKTCITCLKLMEFAADFYKKPESKKRQLTAEIFDSLSNSLSEKERLLGEDHLEVATILQLIGDICDALRDNKDQALNVLKRCLDIRKSQLSHDHPDVAAATKSIADLYYNHDENTEAAHFYRLFLDLATSSLGEHHRDVIDAKSKYNYISNADLSQKIKIYGELIEEGRGVLGNEHPTIGYFWNNMCLLHWRSGDRDAALKAIQQSSRIYYASCGNMDSRVANSLVSVGRIEGHMGESVKELEAYEAALKILQDNNLGSPQEVVDLLNDCGRVSELIGNSTNAIESYTAALSIREQAFVENGEECEEYAESFHQIGFLYAKQGDITTGLSCLCKSLRIKSAIHKSPHKSVEETLWAIAIWQEDRGDKDGAIRTFQKTLQTQIALYGKHHLHVSQTLQRLANLFEERGHDEGALEHFREVLRTQKRLNRDSSELVETLTRIGHIYMHRRELKEMLTAFSEAANIAAKPTSEVVPSPDADNLRWYDIKFLCPDGAPAA
eukprot:CAMPEP_0113538400 /NCGR_PEP_ID=MMETSP0015_2-20120614/7343_1 /TAXON_ID=2838 /ORGANISM="Odontella" /LENGTH=722 /DNA_ID=CAMNT_0000437967 /DNA_START=89 /DNA_END=2257 /DNA_ORIENTATION=- /assembly_acc=CAM_ASM_000160